MKNCWKFVVTSILTFGTYIRLGKTGSLGPWSSHGLQADGLLCSKLCFCQNYPLIGGSFWLKHSLLQQTMTLLQGPQRSRFANPNLHVPLCSRHLDLWLYQLLTRMKFQKSTKWKLHTIYEVVNMLFYQKTNSLMILLQFCFLKNCVA